MGNVPSGEGAPYSGAGGDAQWGARRRAQGRFGGAGPAPGNFTARSRRALRGAGESAIARAPSARTARRFRRSGPVAGSGNPISGNPRRRFRRPRGRPGNGAILGRRQVVRHRFLVSTFPGSNPGAPANFAQRRSGNQIAWRRTHILRCNRAVQLLQTNFRQGVGVAAGEWRLAAKHAAFFGQGAQACRKRRVFRGVS